MSKFLPLWPDQASSSAGQVDMLYIYLLLVAGAMTALIFVAIAVMAIKYRRVPGREAQQIEGSTLLELTWSIIPFFVMLSFFIWGAAIYFRERTPPADASEIYVVAKQWMWKFEHMEGQREINELHVPAGQNVKLIMTSHRSTDGQTMVLVRSSEISLWQATHPERVRPVVAPPQAPGEELPPFPGPPPPPPPTGATAAIAPGSRFEGRGDARTKQTPCT